MGGQYRLEVAVRRLSHLSEAMLARRTGLSVLVHFADFPVIWLRPAAAALSHTPQAVAFHVCHRADFESEGAVFRAPSSCACELVEEASTPGAPSRVLARWECLIPPVAQANAALSTTTTTRRGRPYTTYMMRDETGATVGAAEMDCRVFALGEGGATAVMKGNDTSNNVSSNHNNRRNGGLELGTLRSPRDGRRGEVAAHATGNTPRRGGGGTPYIVRVVVSDKGASRPRSTSTNATATIDDAKHAASTREGQSPLPAATNKAATTTKTTHTLLYLLQYDVAYQLQSMCDTLATTLQRREHGALSAAPDATTRSLCHSLRRKVAHVVRLGNIVQQATAALTSAETVAPPAKTQQPVAPSASVSHARRGTLAYCLTYDVLYQLQCVSAALGHLVSTHRDALALPLSALPEQHYALRDFCRELVKTVQAITRQLNILLVQTTLEPSQRSSSPTRRAQSKSTLFSSSSSSTITTSSSSSRSSSRSSSTVTSLSSRKTSNPGERSAGNSPAATLPAQKATEHSVTPPQNLSTAPVSAPPIPLPTPPPSPPRRVTEPSLSITPLPATSIDKSTPAPPPVIVTPLPASNTPQPQPLIASPPPPAAAAFTPLAIPQLLSNVTEPAVPSTNPPPSLPIPSIPLPVPPPPHA